MRVTTSAGAGAPERSRSKDQSGKLDAPLSPSMSARMSDGVALPSPLTSPGRKPRRTLTSLSVSSIQVQAPGRMALSSITRTTGPPSEVTDATAGAGWAVPPPCVTTNRDGLSEQGSPLSVRSTKDHPAGLLFPGSVGRLASIEFVGGLLATSVSGSAGSFTVICICVVLVTPSAVYDALTVTHDSASAFSALRSPVMETEANSGRSTDHIVC